MPCQEYTVKTEFTVLCGRVNKTTDENITELKKQKLIAGVTELLETVLDKNPKTTIVVIDEIATDNWGINGKSVTQLKSN
jgi:4-oxalocrotonate tautomerase